MNFVQPIRDRKKIAQIKNLLKGEGRWRDLLLFVVGINTALRVSDLLALRIGQFVEPDGTVRDSFRIHDKKTGKANEVVINEAIREALAEYLKAYPDITSDADNYVFFSPHSNYRKPIGRKMAWKLISDVCHAARLKGSYGTHSLRKTWGYHARMSGVDLGLIMEALNHSSMQMTKRYLGITADELGAVKRKLNL